MKREARPIKIDRRLTGANIIDEPLQQVSFNQYYLICFSKYWVCNVEVEVVVRQIEVETGKWKKEKQTSGMGQDIEQYFLSVFCILQFFSIAVGMYANQQESFQYLFFQSWFYNGR